MSIKVAVCGALGKMGRATVEAVRSASDLELVALCDRDGGELDGMPIWKDLAEAVDDRKPDVCVEFTHPSVAAEHALACLKHGVSPVIGTSGLSPGELDKIRAETTLTPAIVVPNFAIGAILMMRFSEMAAKWMSDCAVIELHRAEKPDAPSGTAMHTAERIAKGRAASPPPPAPEEEGGRGVEVPVHKVLAEGALGANVDGVPVHSIRLKGLLAHQEVLFGSAGETLTIRHDSLDRSSFMPGVLLAVRKVKSLKGLTVGLEGLMFEE